MLSFDSTKGIVIVAFQNTNKAGGYGGSISAGHGTSFTLTQGTSPMYSSTTVANGQEFLIFPNTEAGTTTVAVTPPTGKTCTPNQAITNWRVDPATLSGVLYNCM